MRAMKEIWIGMLEVRPRMDAKVIAEARGAFVNIITWAEDSEEFCRKATELMNDLHLELVSVEKPEPLINRGPEEELGEEIVDIASQVRRNPDAIMYSTFHSWCEQIQ
jgi:hypothetical protein